MQGGAQAVPLMTGESITILRARGRRLAKLIHADGTVEGFDRARTVDLIEHPVADLPAIARLLDRLLGRPDCCVVRGAVIDPARARGVRRLFHRDASTGDAATLREVPRRWLALDLDSLPAPDGLHLGDLEACGRTAVAALPVAFHDAAYIVQATAGHTFKPGLRLRLWYWLDRPVTGAELKRWFHGTPVDLTVFGAVQPIYTAGPTFPDRPDPLPARLMLLPGNEVVVVPPSEALAPPPRPPPAPLKVRVTTAGRYTRRALERATERILGAPARHPVILAEARGLGRLVTAGLLAEADMRQVIHAAARAAGKDDPAEIDAIIAWAGTHPSGTWSEVHHAR